VTPRHRPHRRVAVAVLAAASVLVACDGDDAPSRGEDPPPADGGADPEEDAGDDQAGTLPEVVLLDRDEVERDAADGTLDGALASALEGTPDGWQLAVVPDPDLGPYVLGLPPGSQVWRVGEDLGPLTGAAEDEAWIAYWEPVLADASEAAATSSLRAAVVLPAGGADGAELHLTLSATPQQDLPVDDPQAVAEAFAESFGQAGLDVDEVGTATAGPREVAALAATTPDDEFEDGVPRRLRQWFTPDPPVLWSVTCEGPAPATAVVDETCPSVLASFRPPPR
jgi:hypothetical protein